MRFFVWKSVDTSQSLEVIPSEPVLNSAKLFTRTGDHAKDDDTGVYTYVRTANKQTLLAKVENADNCKKACKYKNYSEHTVELTVVSRLPKSQCQDFIVELGSRAYGNDKWKVEVARVTLYFSDGTNLVQEVRDRTLDGRDLNYTSTEF
jgi:hypothetical protein